MPAKSPSSPKRTKAPPAAAAKPTRKAPASKGKTEVNAGLIDPDAIFSAPGLAAELAAAADALSAALETGHFCDAIERNLELWVAIKSMVARRNGQVDPDTRASLTQIADQVAITTFAMAQNFTPEGVLPLVTIDLEVSKALVDGVLNKMIRDRAYFLWEESGGRHGNDQQYWYQAEQDIRGALTA